MRSLFVLCSLFLLGAAGAAELYRSVDSKGNVQYGDHPLPDAEEVVRLKSGSESAAEMPLSYEARRAKENFPVTLYLFEGCGNVCQQAKSLLKQRGIPYAEKVLASQDDMEAFRKASNGDQIPSVQIGGVWLKGFLAEQWNHELDLAGYPKTAPYRNRPASPAAAPAQ